MAVFASLTIEGEGIKMAYCSNCGAQLADGANVCSICGKPTGSMNAAQNVYQQPAGQSIYQQPAGQNVYQQPAGQNVYQQPAGQNIYQQPAGQYYQQTPMGGRQTAKEPRKINVIAIVAAALLAVSTILPYASFEGYFKEALIDGDGVFFLIVAAIALIGALVKRNVVVIIGGILACILTVIEVVAMFNHEMVDYITKEAGFYMMIVSSIFVLISGFISNKAK